MTATTTTRPTVCHRYTVRVDAFGATMTAEQAADAVQRNWFNESAAVDGTFVVQHVTVDGTTATVLITRDDTQDHCRPAHPGGHHPDDVLAATRQLNAEIGEATAQRLGITGLTSELRHEIIRRETVPLAVPAFAIGQTNCTQLDPAITIADNNDTVAAAAFLVGYARHLSRHLPDLDPAGAIETALSNIASHAGMVGDDAPRAVIRVFGNLDRADAAERL